MTKTLAGVGRTLLLFCAGAGACICVLGPQNSAQSTSGQRVFHDRFDYGELTRVPEKARGRRNPLDSDRDAVPAGRKLFAQHCAECHGSTAEGGKKAPSLRATEVQQATPGTLFWILTNGVVRRGMPVWSKLPEPQRWQIVSYIKTLGAVSTDEPVPGASPR